MQYAPHVMTAQTDQTICEKRFLSPLTGETQRTLANMMSHQAVKLGYANPAELDVDSTIQSANIAYPAIANWLVKVAILATTVGRGLNQPWHGGAKVEGRPGFQQKGPFPDLAKSSRIKT